IGQESGLRYASNIIATSTLLSQKRKSRAVDIQDVERSYRLFYDPVRSVRFVSEFEKRLIGEEGDVDFSTAPNPAAAPGGEPMELS
ncbi:RuvB-like protein 2, partial [Ascosphaera atra]